MPLSDASSAVQPWYRPTLLKGGGGCTWVVAILPTHANGQFGIDTAAILAALSKMQSLMNTYIAAPLRTINQYEQSTAKYEQEVMYPLTAINQAKTSVMQFENQFNQVSGMFRVNVSSATLPQSQNLEALLLSRNAGNVPTVSGQFQNVYGVVMPQNAASPQMRTMTDYDGRAGTGRDEAGHRDRRPRGRGVERGQSDGTADLAGSSR